MRRLLVLMALLPACREPAHISVKLEMLCGQTPMGIPLPQQCSDMHLECANFVEVRLYEANGDQLGNILGSKCISLDSFSPRPHNLCDLQAQQSTLLDSLPEGKTVKFRMRALLVTTPSNGCIDDLPGVPVPEVVFDGFSAAVPIDGHSHEATVQIGTCGSCINQQPACNSTNPNCPPPPMCLPGQIPVGLDPTNCCAIGCKDCDPTSGQNCIMPTNCMGVMCPPPGPCPDGSMPTPFPGDCCLRCRDPNGMMPPTVMPDGGVN